MDKIWDNGFRQTTSSSKPINGPDDLKGFKIRVPVSPLWTSMFKAFDAAPASINFSEVYSALQTKIVEGQENPLAIISTAKLYEVQKYLLADQPHVGRLLVPGQPPRLGEAAGGRPRRSSPRTSTRPASRSARTSPSSTPALQQELAGKGLTFNQPDVTPFRDKLRSAGFYAEWKGKYGDEAWALLEKSVGKLS